MSIFKPRNTKVSVGLVAALLLVDTQPPILAHQAPVKGRFAVPAATNSRFQTLLNRYCAAWSNTNGQFRLSEIAPLYAKDADLVFFDAPVPTAFVGYSQMAAGAKELSRGLKSMTLTPPRDMRVYKRGSLVWTTATIPIRFSLKDGKVVQFPMRQTAIWERSGTRWHMVHEHISAPLSAK
jgi:ketosteroid isomerase-like protein